MDFELTREEKEFREEVDAVVKQLLPANWDDLAIYWPADTAPYRLQKVSSDSFPWSLTVP